MPSNLAKASPPATTSSGGETITAEALGHQLRASLPPIRLHSVSLYNAEGDVLWLSEGALGPDEHSVVLDAIQTLHGDSSMSYHESGLDDGRFGIFLPVRSPRGALVGLAMILTDLKLLPDGIAERLATPKVRTILQRVAVFLRVGSGQPGDTASFPAPLMPQAVNELLTLELVPDKPAVPAPSPPVVKPNSVADVASDLTLYVQELVKLRSNGRTRRYEVLARSKRELERNQVPQAFVADSAKGHDGAALDDLVVQQLFAWLGNHPQVWEGEPASFSINLSIGALEDDSFLDGVAAALKTTRVPAECIGFEITEFACVQCKPKVQRFIAACEKLGCFVVLDNFTFDSGAIPLMASKAVRMVKIDSKLTIAVLKEKLPQALVIAIVNACKVLGVHCIAKRVESQRELDWLEAAGCDLAQGFALEKPLSLQTLAASTAAVAKKKRPG